MTKVHLLSDELISKIAAGEVIERPASVLKELIENAIDAGTGTVEITLEDGGRKLIAIKDSGTGIEAGDIETIFLRHSTSKIKNIDDLFNIQSLGFRGEALYSVAAIADIVLRSKTDTQDTGREIHMRGGKKISLKPVTMDTGTQIEVRELFFNTPARRKFLKSNSTEINQIINTLIPYTLLNPSCQFRLTHQGKNLVDLPPAKELTHRVAAALHLNEKFLLEAKQHFPQRNIAVHMVLGDINVRRSRRDLQFIFINGRPVLDKVISFHLNEVFRLVLPPGNFPFFALYIQMPPEDIDVNIHPTKREVKINDEHHLASLLRHMAEATLMSAGGVKQANITAIPAAPAQQPAKGQFSIGRALFGLNKEETSLTPEPPVEKTIPAQTTPSPTEQYSFAQAAETSTATLFGEKSNTLKSKLSRSHYIGTFRNKFLFFEVEQSLLVMDQHAAQERITFEHLIIQMDKGRIEVQHLLSPYLIKLTAQDLLNWEEAKERLDTLGFSSTQFDPETVAVHTYPVLLKDPAASFQDILAGGNAARCDHQTIAQRACRCSIMAGDPLNIQQIEYLREQLLACRDPFTCPHGRPTVVEMTENFIDKQFLRT